MTSFLFTGLPYVCLAIFIIGSIVRFKTSGFTVSSLSSQFLEGNILFWGSRPFHWGIIFLFFGHLTAFLFPRTLLAWNSVPIRLLIIEISAFAFAILALIGLLALIWRRITNRKLQVVTSKMDVVVYLVLLIQIFTGIWIAEGSRWGSSWFASSLTPYLKSVLFLKPDISVISEMSFVIQLHVVTAFLFVALIPFTRWMHFLVYPVQYLWRAPQLVIWNWDRKKIRTSENLLPEIKPKNE